ncbi:MAG: hypothetical protein AAFR55_07725, partial [Pseudomonadota bacterium]
MTEHPAVQDRAASSQKDAAAAQPVASWGETAHAHAEGPGAITGDAADNAPTEPRADAQRPPWRAALRDAGAVLARGTNVSSLPTKLLILTSVFVMIAEVLIFVPSISYYRLNWLNDRLSAAYIASLATSAAPTGQMPRALRDELLSSAGVKAIAVKTDARRRMILSSDRPLVIDASFAVTPTADESLWGKAVLKLGEIRDAIYVFFAPAGRMIRAYGMPSTIPSGGPMVEIILEEDVLRAAMLGHARNIFWLS